MIFDDPVLRSFRRFSEVADIISPYCNNILSFITETECVYCTVRRESINAVQVNLLIQKGSDSDKFKT
jgi:hypothetical protein